VRESIIVDVKFMANEGYGLSAKQAEKAHSAVPITAVAVDS
jgi:hypothetical protein